MIPHVFRKKNPDKTRALNREGARIRAKVCRVVRWRARKGYGCDAKALTLREIYA